MVSGSKVNASMDATSIITQVSRDDEQLNVYAGEKGKLTTRNSIHNS